MKELIGKKVTEILIGNGGRSRQEYDRIYGIRLKTSKGYADIIFRNSSMATMEGWLEPASKDMSLLGFKPVLDDWSV